MADSSKKDLAFSNRKGECDSVDYRKFRLHQPLIRQQIISRCRNTDLPHVRRHAHYVMAAKYNAELPGTTNGEIKGITSGIKEILYIWAYTIDPPPDEVIRALAIVSQNEGEIEQKDFIFSLEERGYQKGKDLFEGSAEKKRRKWIAVDWKEIKLNGTTVFIWGGVNLDDEKVIWRTHDTFI